MKDPKFYGVNDVHTMMIPNDTDDFYVGMNVQSNTRSNSEEIVMIISPEQMFEMIEYFETRIIEKRSGIPPINLKQPK